MTGFDIVLGKPFILKVLDKEILLNVYRKGTTSTILGHIHMVFDFCFSMIKKVEGKL